jgi:hypothetical protein
MASKSQAIRPHGSLATETEEEASLPVSTDLLRAEINVVPDRGGDELTQVTISGTTTAIDRKLWALLVFLVWEDLEKKVGIDAWHEMPMQEVQDYFKELSGSRDIDRLWESAQRLARTTATCRHTVKDERVITVSSIFYAQINEELRNNGKFRFNFPPPLIPILKEPMPFARLRMKFMLSLNSKYAVSLYQLFEGIINQKDPSVELTIKELRAVLNVPPNKLKQWVHLWQKGIEPALQELNNNPMASGMQVEHELKRGGRGGKVQSITFRVTKADERLIREDTLKNLQPKAHARKPIKAEGSLPARGIPLFDAKVYENAKKAAPRYDVHALEGEWRDWLENRKEQTPIANMAGHFISFCKNKAQQKSLL